MGDNKIFCTYRILQKKTKSQDSNLANFYSLRVLLIRSSVEIYLLLTVLINTFVVKEELEFFLKNLQIWFFQSIKIRQSECQKHWGKY